MEKKLLLLTILLPISCMIKGMEESAKEIPRIAQPVPKYAELAKLTESLYISNRFLQDQNSELKSKLNEFVPTPSFLVRQGIQSGTISAIGTLTNSGFQGAAILLLAPVINKFVTYMSSDAYLASLKLEQERVTDTNQKIFGGIIQQNGQLARMPGVFDIYRSIITHVPDTQLQQYLREQLSNVIVHWHTCAPSFTQTDLVAVNTAIVSFEHAVENIGYITQSLQKDPLTEKQKQILETKRTELIINASRTIRELPYGHDTLRNGSYSNATILLAATGSAITTAALPTILRAYLKR